MPRRSAEKAAEIGGRPAERPRYARIQAALEDRLRGGVYPVGDLMPTEIELASEFETSRFTIREALRHLSELGYVERKQGVGTRVVSSSPRATFVQSFNGLDELFQVAVETWYALHSITPAILTADLAERVGGVAGERWLRIDGVRWTEPGGRPICYIESYAPARFEPLIGAFETWQGPFFDLLERHSETPIEEASQEIRAAPMPAAFGQRLGQPPGAWALQVLRRYSTAQEVLIASFNWHPADQMTYKMRIQRSRRGADL